MSVIKINTYKSIPAKWLFAVVLLVGIFSYSGLLLSAQSTSPAYQTCLIGNPVNPVVKCITYNRALQQLSNLNSLTVVYTPALLPALSRIYTCRLKVKLAILSASYSSISNTCLSLLNKVIPPNTNDDPAILI